jgi:hypothetical protein
MGQNWVITISFFWQYSFSAGRRHYHFFFLDSTHLLSFFYHIIKLNHLDGPSMVIPFCLQLEYSLKK